VHDLLHSVQMSKTTAKPTKDDIQAHNIHDCRVMIVEMVKKALKLPKVDHRHALPSVDTSSRIVICADETLTQILCMFKRMRPKHRLCVDE
jgi:hypothetical protein